jgi:hypothetical protein
LIHTLWDYFTVLPVNYNNSLVHRHIPESFIWHLFEGLVDACLVLGQGRRDVAFKDWKPLVHNNLHEGNILLNSDPNDPLVSVGWRVLEVFGTLTCFVVATDLLDRFRQNVLRLES